MDVSQVYMKAIAGFIRTLIFIGIGIGIALVAYKNFIQKPLGPKGPQSKAEQVRAHLAKYKKPSRVEVESFTQRYEHDIADIKKVKISLDPKATFFIQLQLFADDGDETSPLVAQFRFIDIASENNLREESINLE